MLVWRKLASAKWEDAWVERLQFIDPRKLAIFAVAGSKAIRIEAYALSPREGKKLVAAFGGQLKEVKKELALPAATANAKPLLIRDRLVVVRSPEHARELAPKYPGRAVLIIPAAMAFGTGDHATTAACLRMVCDFAAQREPGSWEMLDLGCGTGILALAARALGASHCDAYDFDAACVRAAAGNARLSQIRGITTARQDVTLWQPARQWDLVAANLFSEVLLKAREPLVRAVAPGGRLILSGMLATQAGETLAGYEKQGVKFELVVKRGKWVTARGELRRGRKRNEN